MRPGFHGYRPNSGKICEWDLESDLASIEIARNFLCFCAFRLFS